MKLFKTLAVSAAVTLASTSGVVNAGTLQDVKARGELNCVVTTGVAGFAAQPLLLYWVTRIRSSLCRLPVRPVLRY